jgi:hypothetical protein
MVYAAMLVNMSTAAPALQRNAAADEHRIVHCAHTSDYILTAPICEDSSRAARRESV